MTPRMFTGGTTRLCVATPYYYSISTVCAEYLFRGSSYIVLYFCIVAPCPCCHFMRLKNSATNFLPTTHKIMLTLMDWQPSDRVCTAHEHVWSLCLRSFMLSTLACQSNFGAVWRGVDLCTLKCVPGLTCIFSWEQRVFQQVQLLNTGKSNWGLKCGIKNFLGLGGGTLNILFLAPNLTLFLPSPAVMPKMFSSMFLSSELQETFGKFLVNFYCWKI